MGFEKRRNGKGGKIEIDLAGPEGNSYVLLGYAKRYCQQLGLDYQRVSTEMKASDYDNLIQVFNRYFGELATLYYSNERT